MIRGVIFDFNRTLYDPDSRQLAEGALQLLGRLRSRGYAMCLISKKSAEDRRGHIASLGIGVYFKRILVIEGSKQEAHFSECMDAMALPSREIAVVGDRIREEIALGNRMGMRTVWYRAGKFADELPEGEDQEPWATVTSLDDVWVRLQAAE
ncbi:MAG: HAD hydrolase-like protein [Candidatus Marsarchaeota archaeon]|nr:HAD hydrolase-like protein [Candidatus Marsarchaeota archaeon]